MFRLKEVGKENGDWIVFRKGKSKGECDWLESIGKAKKTVDWLRIGKRVEKTLSSRIY